MDADEGRRASKAYGWREGVVALKFLDEHEPALTTCGGSDRPSVVVFVDADTVPVDEPPAPRRPASRRVARAENQAGLFD